MTKPSIKKEFNQLVRLIKREDFGRANTFFIYRTANIIEVDKRREPSITLMGASERLNGSDIFAGPSLKISFTQSADHMNFIKISEFTGTVKQRHRKNGDISKIRKSTEHEDNGTAMLFDLAQNEEAAKTVRSWIQQNKAVRS